MSSIQGSRDPFQRALQEQDATRQTALGAFGDAVQSGLRGTGVSAAASVLRPQAAATLQGYAKMFAYLDSPIATAMEDLLAYIGIPPNVFTAAQLLLQGDSIGLDPHEQLGIPAWKYGIIEEIHDLLNELDELERTAGFSYKIDRKNAIEQEVKQRLAALRK